MNYKKFLNVPIYVKVIFVVMVLFALLFIFKPNLYKDFYKLFNKELKQQEVVSKKTYDSLLEQRKVDEQKYNNAIRQKELEIDAISIQLDLQKKKAYKYEKELYNYIRGDFDERYRIFTNLVAKDTFR